MVDGSFWTLNTKRSFRNHMFLLHWTILFSCWMDLFAVKYYFLSTVTLKDLFPGLKKIFPLSRIIFCPLSHKRIFSLLYKKIFFMSRIYFCPVSHWKIFFLLLKRSFLCHIICFCSKVTEVSGVLILKKNQSYFLSFLILCSYF